SRTAGSAWCLFVRAEDGIRDRNVTGVQTCALPILKSAVNQRSGAVSASFFIALEPPTLCAWARSVHASAVPILAALLHTAIAVKIGRAPCRERGGGRDRGSAAQEHRAVAGDAATRR